MLKKLKDHYRTVRTIRKAIDTYPDGICFAASGGRPILVNKTMNRICHALTGHTVTNADEMWENLSKIRLAEPVRETEAILKQGHSEPSPEDEKGTESEKPLPSEENQAPTVILCRQADGSVWQFQKTSLKVGDMPVIQYEASDISELYACQVRLRESIRHEGEIQERQKALLQNIVQNNLEKELLDAKIRIHDSFGRLLIMTKAALEDEASKSDASKLFQAWDDVIADMENAAMKTETENSSPQTELSRVAELIGCRITFQGQQPTERKALLLLCAAIREALTNAVRHAGADELTVTVACQGDFYEAEIQSNGCPAVRPIQEKGGLYSLRKRLEQEGAELSYRYDGPVALILTIPKE